MTRCEFFAVLVRVAICVCVFLALRASMWAAFDPRYNSLLPIFLWMGAAFAWAALIPVIERPWQTTGEVPA